MDAKVHAFDLAYPISEIKWMQK